jgi:molybdopterin-guanine dinucleotide biosynthesis protein A
MEMTGIILAGGKSSRLGFNKIEIKIGGIPLFIDQIFKLSFFCNEILISTTENNYKFVKDELAGLDYYYKYFYKQCNLKRIPCIAVFKDEENLENCFHTDTDMNPRVNPDAGSNCRGPICGIYNGLKHAQNFYSLVLAFDMPFISYGLLNFLKQISNICNEPADAYIIKTKKGFEALCGLYSKNCIELILKNIRNKNYKISDIFPLLNTKLILVDGLTCEFEDCELKKLNQDIDSLNNSKIDSLNFFNINTEEDYKYFLTTWNNNSSIDTTGNYYSNGICSKVNNNFTQDFHIRWKYFFYR